MNYQKHEISIPSTSFDCPSFHTRASTLQGLETGINVTGLSLLAIEFETPLESLESLETKWI